MIPIRPSFTASLLAGTLALGACGSEAPTTPPVDTAADSSATATATSQQAMASLKTADGRDVGTVTATEMAGGISIAVSATGLTPGDRGIHVHTTGQCDGPKFETAGGHWNPVGAKHGLSNPQGAHYGDMPNLTIASDGTGKMEYMIRDAGLAEMLDDDGAALVIHAGADDQMTDPAGDSGDRIACGVFGRG
ncbi:MAG: superoxide dismutase family protein [Blastomonas sp.]